MRLPAGPCGWGYPIQGMPGSLLSSGPHCPGSLLQLPSLGSHWSELRREWRQLRVEPLATGQAAEHAPVLWETPAEPSICRQPPSTCMCGPEGPVLTPRSRSAVLTAAKPRGRPCVHSPLPKVSQMSPIHLPLLPGPLRAFHSEVPTLRSDWAVSSIVCPFLFSTACFWNVIAGLNFLFYPPHLLNFPPDFIFYLYSEFISLNILLIVKILSCFVNGPSS